MATQFFILNYFINHNLRDFILLNQTSTIFSIQSNILEDFAYWHSLNNISEFQSRAISKCTHSTVEISVFKKALTTITYYLQSQTRTMRQLLWLTAKASMMRWTSKAFALLVLMAKSAKSLFRVSPVASQICFQASETRERSLTWHRCHRKCQGYQDEFVQVHKPGAVLGWVDIRGLSQRHPYLSEYTLNKIYLKDTLAKKLYFFKAVNLSKNIHY